MIFQYFAESDMLYIQFSDRPSVESEEVAPGIVVDFDENENAIGIEIEDASKLMDLSKLEVSALPIADLILSQKTPAAAY